jgi:aspartyl-tRNA(Asn)/glutamyl-tRNA(Gln) amidotransferase subunit C
MSKEVINKDIVEHLADLARVKLDENEKGIIEDLKKIVDYFEVLKEVDVENILPVTGGTDLENVVREDKYDEEKKLDGEKAVEGFPEKKDGYLKVPPVF